MSSKLDDGVKIVINYLNFKTGKSFKTAKSNTKFILARFKEGNSVQDLKNVIDIKTDEWLNDQNLSKYLRPATLFNAEKFNQYIGEVGVETPEQRKRRELDEWAMGGKK